MFSYIGHSTVGILVDLWFLGKTLLLWIQNMNNPKSVRVSMLELHWVVQFSTWTNWTAGAPFLSQQSPTVGDSLPAARWQNVTASRHVEASCQL